MKEGKSMKNEITFDKFIRYAMVVGIIVVVLYFMNYLSGVLLPFFVAWLLAYLLYPLVKFVQYRMHVPTRPLSIIITFVGVLAILLGIMQFIIPPMMDQIEKLGEQITIYLKQQTNSNDLSATIKEWLRNNRGQITDIINSKDFTDAVKATLPGVFSFLGQTANVILSLIASLITLLYMFFILLDYEYLTSNWIRIFPKKARPFWRELMSDVEHNLNAYIRGQGFIAFLVGILFCIGFTIIDFPMAIGLGVFIGCLNLVPYLQTVGFIPTIALAALKSVNTGENFWIILISVLAVFVVVQIIQDMILTPKIMGKNMGLNPAILLLSLSVWGALLGFIGLIIALPATALIISYYQKYVTRESEPLEPNSEGSLGEATQNTDATNTPPPTDTSTN